MKLKHYVAATAFAVALSQTLSAAVSEGITFYGSGWATVPIVLPSLFLIGALEGVLVGSAQAYVLRGVVPPLRFVLATTSAMTLAWGMGVLASFVEPNGVTLNPLFAIVMGGVLGVIVGGSLGLAQDRVFARAGINTTKFIGFSALAWGVMHLVLVMLGDLAEPEALLARLAVRAGVGALSGAVVGLVAGPSLVAAIGERRDVTLGARPA